MSQSRPQHITLRVDADEGNKIRRIAATNDESVSAYLRRLVVEDEMRTYLNRKAS